MARYIDADKLVVWCNETYQVQSTSSGKAYVNAFLTKVLSCPTANVAPMEDAEKLRAENKKLFDEAENQSTLWKQHFESLYETAKETVKADTVKKMRERLKAEFGNSRCQAYRGNSIHNIIDQIAKEILEGGDTE
jgi:hypothetical protein